jgi:hypothetical protein
MKEGHEGSVDFWVESTVPSMFVEDFGAPATIWTGYHFKAHDTQAVDITLMIFNKTSTRIPEALWFTFK